MGKYRGANGFWSGFVVVFFSFCFCLLHIKSDRQNLFFYHQLCIFSSRLYYLFLAFSGPSRYFFLSPIHRTCRNEINRRRKFFFLFYKIKVVNEDRNNRKLKLLMNNNWVCEASRLRGEISDLEEADLMMAFYLARKIGVDWWNRWIENLKLAGGGAYLKQRWKLRELIVRKNTVIIEEQLERGSFLRVESLKRGFLWWLERGVSVKFKTICNGFLVFWSFRRKFLE